MHERDWFEWHKPYDEAGSALSERLAIVQGYVTAALDSAPPGTIRAVSMCAGQGRDLIGAVGKHARREDVRARLVELDPRNAEVAASLGRQAGLEVDVVTGDASLSDAYEGAVPAGIVLACGIFGNISDADIHRTIGLLPMLCEEGATVIWTRHCREPDLTPSVRRWLAEAGFEPLGWAGSSRHDFIGVGAERWPGKAGNLRTGVRFFTFLGDPRPAPS